MAHLESQIRGLWDRRDGIGLPGVLVVKPLEPGERHDKAKLNDVLREHGGTL